MSTITRGLNKIKYQGMLQELNTLKYILPPYVIVHLSSELIRELVDMRGKVGDFPESVSIRMDAFNIITHFGSVMRITSELETNIETFKDTEKAKKWVANQKESRKEYYIEQTLTDLSTFLTDIYVRASKEIADLNHQKPVYYHHEVNQILEDIKSAIDNIHKLVVELIKQNIEKRC